MKVYICFDRYERNEWFNVFHIGTRKSDSIKKVKEEILPDFIDYGPDDCHSFQLVIVDMTKRDYEQLLKWNSEENCPENYGEESSDYFKWLCELYDIIGMYDCDLISTDGCSDFYEILKFYGRLKGIDPEDFEDYEDELQEELCELDDQIRLDIIKHYVHDMY